MRQVSGVLRLELRKILFGKRAAPLYLLAALPPGLCVLFVLVSLVAGTPDELRDPGRTAGLFAILFQFLLRGMLYLGSVWVFMNLFRGEVLDRSLHYYFLAPIRREVLVAGKFLAGWIAASAMFVASTWMSLAVLYGHYGIGAAADYLLRGPGLAHWPGYAGIVVLACLGYGALFLLVGLFFKNPVVPAVVIFLWEVMNPFLPALLKKFSVVFYLISLLPVPVPVVEGAFALLADPVSPWLSVPGLLLFAAILLAVASARVRKMEIAYGGD
jgi:ABC-type transport system involved in multi-copper enzyme maturation permease subunit